jgi:hypothetical protein
MKLFIFLLWLHNPRRISVSVVSFLHPSHVKLVSVEIPML